MQKNILNGRQIYKSKIMGDFIITGLNKEPYRKGHLILHPNNIFLMATDERPKGKSGMTVKPAKSLSRQSWETTN
jgi:hypothetical protein